MLWGVLMAFLSLLPAIGAGLVWLPVAVYLLLSGALWQGMALIAYGVLVIGLVFWGSLQDLGTVFAFADVTMGLLAIANLIALALLFKIGLRLMRDYDSQIKAGVESPTFDPKVFADLDLDPKAWPNKVVC